MERKSKKTKRSSGAERDVRCSVCGSSQKAQIERFRICSGCKETLGIKRYFCSRACQKTDWKTHKESCGSQDFWDYPCKPLLDAKAQFERPPALRCQIALIDSNPDVLYNILPCTNDAVRFGITNKMMNTSFRRVRDNAFLTRDPRSIAILGETLVRAAEMDDVAAGRPVSAQRLTDICKQLEEEYGTPNVHGMVLDLLDEQNHDPLYRTSLECLHQENMANHGSDFWKALAKPLD
ncbi:hypothetical protein C8J57DRAFT_338308 [Mycena rebaudengoi]|nr:hypothetical protein C8J57DRAFT_338308 [Mycena rebaudengoi]